MKAATILVVDDEPQIRRVMRTTLTAEGYAVIEARDGAEALEKLRSERPDLILLDMNMPVMDGLQTCREIRGGSEVPIIMLTVRNAEKDKVRALDAGADDYVVKPFGARELLARIRAVLRRQPGSQQKVLAFADVEVNLDRRVVTRRDQEIRFTPAEYNLLTFFLQNPDRPLSRDMILNSVWGYESFPNTRTVDAHVVRLRQKLEADPNCPRHFLTLHKVGYRFLP